jgi:hypothetical protein
MHGGHGSRSGGKGRAARGVRVFRRGRKESSGVASRCSGLMQRTVPGFRPGGRLTFLCEQESKQRNRPCKTAPAGSPAMLERQGLRRTRAATLCSNNCAESVVEALFERASPFCASRRFRRGGPRPPNSQAQRPAGGCISLAPLSTAGNPQRSLGWGVRGELFGYFLADQKVHRRKIPATHSPATRNRDNQTEICPPPLVPQPPSTTPPRVAILNSLTSRGTP